jgi:alkanesulfonate monooxygenase SsuD/methylene tetrahydromethanopterin reductase-like flavin-dependent oxidoreductase (luciferase family)
MRFGLDVATDGPWADPRLLVELAREAESAGWDGFFVWDIFFPEEATDPVADPWIALAAVGAATSRIRIGAMVTPFPRRQPWDVARSLVTLDHLTDGRALLGAGLGWRAEELDRLGLAADMRSRVERLEEGLLIVDRLWSGEPFSHVGRQHRLADVQVLPRPIQRPRIPIWLAAGWPRTAPLRRAMQWDGVCLMAEHQFTGERISPDDVRAVAALVGLERQDAFDIAANVATLEEADGGRSVAQAMADAGATWIVELTPETVDEHLALIRRGPPQVASRNSAHGS